MQSLDDSMVGKETGDDMDDTPSFRGKPTWENPKVIREKSSSIVNMHMNSMSNEAKRERDQPVVYGMVESDIPFAKAINLLKILPCHQTPISKLEVLMKVFDAIDEYVQHMDVVPDNYELGTDSILALYIYTVIKSRIPNLYSEYQFMKHFIDDRLRYTTSAEYRLATLEATIMYIETLDWKVREEDGRLIPVFILCERLKDECEVQFERYQENDKLNVQLNMISADHYDSSNDSLSGQKIAVQDLPMDGIPMASSSSHAKGSVSSSSGVTIDSDGSPMSFNQSFLSYAASFKEYEPIMDMHDVGLKQTTMQLRSGRLEFNVPTLAEVDPISRSEQSRLSVDERIITGQVYAYAESLSPITWLSDLFIRLGNRRVNHYQPFRLSKSHRRDLVFTLDMILPILECIGLSLARRTKDGEYSTDFEFLRRQKEAIEKRIMKEHEEALLKREAEEEEELDAELQKQKEIDDDFFLQRWSVQRSDSMQGLNENHESEVTLTEVVLDGTRIPVLADEMGSPATLEANDGSKTPVIESVTLEQMVEDGEEKVDAQDDDKEGDDDDGGEQDDNDSLDGESETGESLFSSSGTGSQGGVVSLLTNELSDMEDDGKPLMQFESHDTMMDWSEQDHGEAIYVIFKQSFPQYVYLRFVNVLYELSEGRSTWE
eukprot:TRINITY_DN5767_c0_g1_i1.p1 TRINITY_DN5767_c0_g1~~TRINITY_DN5767_c0_g1_i1.p1  ORF type:complete len:696 (-),score=265.60 TRINITY_DN5767_c0_g1_i1:35-2014(-)